MEPGGQAAEQPTPVERLFRGRALDYPEKRNQGDERQEAQRERGKGKAEAQAGQGQD